MIFAPSRTRTFKNEKSAITLAEEIRKILETHNKMFKQKMDFGISINCGNIVAGNVGNEFKFMSLGNFSSLAKKLSSVSEGGVVLSSDLKNRIMSEIKTEKKSSEGLDYYVLTEVKDRSKSEKFIKDFVKKMERERKKED